PPSVDGGGLLPARKAGPSVAEDRSSPCGGALLPPGKSAPTDPEDRSSPCPVRLLRLRKAEKHSEIPSDLGTLEESTGRPKISSRKRPTRPGHGSWGRGDAFRARPDR